MTRWVLTEVARWTRAVILPAVVIAAVVAARPALAELPSAPPSAAMSMAWSVVLIAATTWLVAAVVRVARLPGNDRRAAEHLQDMRVRAGLPDHALLCVLSILWDSPAGQRVAAVNVQTGSAFELWLAESGAPPGAYVLVCFRRGAGSLLDTATALSVLAAKRHDSRSASKSRTLDRAAGAVSRDRRAEGEVVRAAEALIRRT